MKQSYNYPEPFNHDLTLLEPGDRVIDKRGLKGTVLGEKDFDGYKRNYLGPKWELVAWDDNTYYPEKCWIGKRWIKKL